MVNDSAIRWQRDDDGIVTLTMDDPTQRVNTLNELFARSFAEAVGRLEAERETITGVILASAKSTFMAGGDLNRLFLIEPAGRDDFVEDLTGRKAMMRRLETLGRPVVAVISGAALGGGLELALLCHRRVAVENGRVLVGLPEATLGLLPGGGGVVRVTRMRGLARALDLILSGVRLGARQGQALGLIDELAASDSEALEKARRWIRENPAAAQPWDVPERQQHRAGAGDDNVAPVALSDPRGNGAAPAPNTIVDVAVRSLETTVDDALRIETEGLADLVVSDSAKATIQVVFFDTVKVRSRLRKSGGDAPRTPVLVLRAGSPANRLAADALGGHITVVDPDGGPRAEAVVVDLRNRPDHVVLDVADADAAGGGAATEVWLHVDGVGDGGLVLEYAARDGELADILPVFSKLGVLPIALRPGQGSFGARLRTVIAQASADLRQEGASPAEIHAALSWVGLPTSDQDPADETLDRDRIRALGMRLLDVVARRAAAADVRNALVHPEDLDVASVRVGGFPSWTGGVGRWLTHARAAEVALTDNLRGPSAGKALA